MAIKKLSISVMAILVMMLLQVALVSAGGPIRSFIRSREAMAAPDLLESPNRLKAFVLAKNGEGSVTDEWGKLLWSTKKSGPSDKYALVLSDKGVVRIFKPDGEVLSQWGGGKGRRQGIYTLSMNDNGSLTISDPHGKTVWSSKKK
jgi:hypothetical protein